MPADKDGFDRAVPLPPELRIAHIREAIAHVEDRAAELIDIYAEQANVFSGIVGIMGIQALHALSPYKKHKHPDVAQQRFPDLSLRGRLNPPAEQAVESKGKGSKAAEGRGGRTHTFGVKLPAKRFTGSIVYQHPKIVVRQGGPVLANGD